MISPEGHTQQRGRGLCLESNKYKEVSTPSVFLDQNHQPSLIQTRQHSLAFHNKFQQPLLSNLQPSKMLSHTVVIALIGALAGQATAQSCTVGQKYCGATLLNGSSKSFSLLMGQVKRGNERKEKHNTHKNRDMTDHTLPPQIDDAYWHHQMEIAQGGLEPGRRWDALWTCQAGNTLSYDDYCPRTGLLCQPNRSRKCNHPSNDCCAAA